MHVFEEVIRMNMKPLKYAFSKLWKIYHFMDACLWIIHKGYGFISLKKLECQIWEDSSSRLSTLNAFGAALDRCRSLKKIPEWFGNFTCSNKL